MVHPKFYIYVDDLRRFTKESMQWCINESENAAKAVAQSLDFLVKETERVSKFSRESAQAIEILETQLKAFISKSNGDITLAQFTSTVGDLLKYNGDLKDIIDPIVQALQFQDRLRQNLENQQKMILIWLEIRARIQKDGEITNELLSKFSKALGDATTMKEERDILRKYLPNEYLPDEQEKGSEEDVLFF